MADQAPRKKILFVLPRLYPGGAERVMITLMNNLDRDKFDIHFVSLSGEGTIRHWIESDIAIRSLNKKTMLGGVWGLYGMIRSIRPDTVISTMIHTNAALLLLRPLFRKTRFIIRESALPSALIGRKGIKGLASRCIYKFLYPYADLVICPADAIIKQFQEILEIDTSRHITLYNPVDENRLHGTISDFDTDPKQRLKTLRFICVGRLDHEKGYDRLIEALLDFRMAGGLDWRLDIVGKGLEIKKLGDLIRQHNLTAHIHLAGHHNTPWPLMAEADCLLLPSRSEGMPNVALESLACGTRVIAHKDAGGIAEIAAMAGAENVKIAADMNQFVHLMSEVKPALPKLPIVSRLPADFRLKTVMAKFETLL